MTHILITGGSRGIGRALAKLAAARGWDVSINFAGNARAAEETAAAVRSAGARAAIIQGDVADENDVVRIFDEAEAAFGPVDHLANNAGVVGPSQKLADMDVARIRRLIDINVTGALLVAREAARRMGTDRGGRGGTMVITSSVAARLGSPNIFVDYAASKGATDTMTIGLAQELGPVGIRVNAIRPGLIDTEIHTDASAPDRAHELGPKTPIGRAGAAEEVAEAIIWLMSDQSSYVMGALLDVSGGR
jgi:NAD(P)-dependent dehydrogenase (short-subunit alcohol dehydrogenase family)